MNRHRLVSVGKITGPHGFKGTLKLWSHSESTAFFESNTKICVRYADGEFAQFTVGWVKPHKKGFLLFFREPLTYDQARDLIDAEILVERKDLPDIEEGSYYWVDLIGLSVFTTDGVFIGVLDSVVPTGSNDVYVIKDEKTEFLVPALESVVVKVDLEENIMHVRLPEGL